MFKVGEKVDVVYNGKCVEGTVLAADIRVKTQEGDSLRVVVRHPFLLGDLAEKTESVNLFKEDGTTMSSGFFIRKRPVKRYLNVYSSSQISGSSISIWRKTKEEAVKRRNMNESFVCLLEGDLVDGKIVNVKVVENADY